MKFIGLLLSPELRILQASFPVNGETWDLINEELLTRRPEVQIRVYGFYSLVCDLSFLSRLKNCIWKDGNAALKFCSVSQLWKD